MRKIEPEKPRIGISACLLGQRVRWDGGHKLDPSLMDSLGAVVEWVPVCPEVEIGLGVPRPPLHLAGSTRTPRLVVEGTGQDLTERMRRYAEDRVRMLQRLRIDGYVLKSHSPSCGLLVAVRSRRAAGARGEPEMDGRGLFAAALVRRLRRLPVEEECRLADPAVRERFLQRVLAGARRRSRPTQQRSRSTGCR